MAGRDRGSGFPRTRNPGPTYDEDEEFWRVRDSLRERPQRASDPARPNQRIETRLFRALDDAFLESI